ncbi:P1 family peptidase [Nocardioides sp. GCM10027113]|uniref:P1 family peptidase n=1 Tax=unclassified Nocardioides TaxID=2615069 RepID=UPI0036164D60
MPRARDLGLRIGVLPTGPTNSVLDVAGVGVGHATVHRDEDPPPRGRGVARTGVTAVVLAEDAYRRPVAAGGAVLNGAGECTGFLSAREWGTAETPVWLTSTMQLGRVYDAACEIALEGDAGVADDVVIPVVAECDDSFLNDCRRMQVTADDVRAAYDAALASRGSSAPPAEGAVGAGTGMSCFELKGGIGTASRVVPGGGAGGYTVGVLLLTNFGTRDQAVVAGVPVGRLLLPAAGPGPARPAGSCIGLVVTDAPVDGHGCERLARRVGLGLARAGSVAHHGSGEIFLGFGTGRRHDRDISPEAGPPVLSGRALDPLFAAVVEAAEEAVLNSMFCAPATTGRDGNTSPSLHSPEVLDLLAGVRS